MTEKEKMLAGEFYNALDPELASLHKHAAEVCKEFNRGEADRRSEIGKTLFGSCGDKCYVEYGFWCDYGFNVHVGENFYANFNFVVLDVCKVEIGDNVLIAPNVSICTATHPIDAKTRASGLEYGKPVKIGNNVWIGANAVINPGVEIGDNCIVASGAVVTKSFGSGLLLAGVPAKPIRRL